MENKTYIEGIFNYCDRWCDKCAFTSMCHLFTMESKIASHEILNDGEKPNFRDIFEEEFSSDAKDAEENEAEEDDDFADGDDDLSFDDEEYETEEDDKIELSTGVYHFGNGREKNKTLLEELSYDFLIKSHSLLDKLTERYPVLQDRFSDEVQNNSVFKKMYDNYEILSWYHTLQYPKFGRAISGKIDVQKEENEDMKAIYAYDMNGSAKIAIISVNKSIKALEGLYSDLPDFSQEIGDLLVILGKLLNEAEREFPDYKNFKRPGLDD